MNDGAAAIDSGDQQRRTFLVVVDGTPEMAMALRFAVRLASRTAGRVALLHVIEPADAVQWISLESLMREERRHEADAMLRPIADAIAAETGTPPVVHLREGRARDQLLRVIDEDPTIYRLILAAGAGDSGPGPLLSALTAGRERLRLRVPLIVVPAGLTDDKIDELA